jgi:two-component system response regulator DesR
VRFDPTDREILRLTAAGLTSAEIGARLHLARSTVKRHLRELLARLGVANRAAAVHVARRLGALEPAGGPVPPPPVSARERDVLCALVSGATNGEIAARLGLSPHTVKQHTSSIYRKLGVRNRAQAAARVPSGLHAKPRR